LRQKVYFPVPGGKNVSDPNGGGKPLFRRFNSVFCKILTAIKISLPYIYI